MFPIWFSSVGLSPPQTRQPSFPAPHHGSRRILYRDRLRSNGVMHYCMDQEVAALQYSRAPPSAPLEGLNSTILSGFARYATDTENFLYKNLTYGI